MEIVMPFGDKFAEFDFLFNLVLLGDEAGHAG